MKPAMIFAAFALCQAAPALATETISCRPADRTGVSLTLVVGTAGIAQVRLTDGPTRRVTGEENAQMTIGQAWLDRQELKLDLLDGNLDESVAQLRTRRTGRDRYAGTLRYRGRVSRATCEVVG